MRGSGKSVGMCCCVAVGDGASRSTSMSNSESESWRVSMFGVVLDMAGEGYVADAKNYVVFIVVVVVVAVVVGYGGLPTRCVWVV